MTTVAVVMRRSYTPDMFADITDISHTRTLDKATGVTTLTFADVLDPADEAAIWARMDSTDDADMTKRANIRALRDAVEADPSLANVTALALASAAYALCE